MWLRKSRAPGSAPGGYAWTTAEDAVEVPDDLAVELLGIRDAGFSEVAPPVVPEAQVPDADAEGAGEDAGTEADAAAAPRRPGRPRKTPVAE
ncbi:hypothetical protein ABH925_001073 [Streptacidiphilus sp. EB129]